MVVVARIGKLETFDSQTDAERYGTQIERLDAAYLASLAVVVAYVDKQRPADVDLDPCTDMTPEVVEKLRRPSRCSDLAREWVDDRRRFERVVINQVPSL